MGEDIFRGYIREFDGLRAIGVVLVILNHMWRWESYSRTVFLALQLSWMLMDSFFVLSGFLITGILLDSRQRPEYYRSFYVRRALRILPIYYAVLIFITVTAAVNGHAAYTDMLAQWGSPWWFFTYLGNIPTAMTGRWPLAAGGALVPLWSLQIEEQFYLLFPLLVHRLRPATLTRVLLLLCGLSTLLRLYFYWRYPANELVQYVLLPCRMEGLALGACMAIRFRQGPWNIDKTRLTALVVAGGIVSIGFAAWAGCFHTQPLNRTIGFLLSPVWFALVVLWLIQFRNSRRTAWLRVRPFQYIGKISYAAYLFHPLAANILTSTAVRLGFPTLDAGLIRLILIFALTFVFSALSWHFFESPLVRLKDKFFPAGRLARAA